MPFLPECFLSDARGFAQSCVISKHVPALQLAWSSALQTTQQQELSQDNLIPARTIPPRGRDFLPASQTPNFKCDDQVPPHPYNVLSSALVEKIFRLEHNPKEGSKHEHML